MSFKLHTQMKDLTELIVFTGYENRLIQGKNGFSWFTRDEESNLHGSIMPLLAGNRILYPEELDEKLANSLNVSKDVDWSKYGREVSKDVSPCATEMLFDVDKITTSKVVKAADAIFACRIKLIKELKKILGDSKKLKHVFENGLVLRLKDCNKPLSILQWICDKNYCTGFSPLEIDEMTIIEEAGHKILIVYYDAESG